MSKRATKDTTTSRKKCRRRRTHTRTITREKKEEPHQAKEQFFLMQTKTTFHFFGKTTFNLTGTFNNNKQTGQLQQKGRMEDLK
jgi:hypothetical protein